MACRTENQYNGSVRSKPPGSSAKPRQDLVFSASREYVGWMCSLGVSKGGQSKGGGFN